MDTNTLKQTWSQTLTFTEAVARILKVFLKKSSDFTEISKCIPEHQLISDFRDWSVQKLDRQEKEQGKGSELKGAAKV